MGEGWACLNQGLHFCWPSNLWSIRTQLGGIPPAQPTDIPTAESAGGEENALEGIYSETIGEKSYIIN